MCYCVHKGGGGGGQAGGQKSLDQVGQQGAGESSKTARKARGSKLSQSLEQSSSGLLSSSSSIRADLNAASVAVRVGARGAKGAEGGKSLDIEASLARGALKATGGSKGPPFAEWSHLRGDGLGGKRLGGQGVQASGSSGEGGEGSGVGLAQRAMRELERVSATPSPYSPSSPGAPAWGAGRGAKTGPTTGERDRP